MQQLQFVNHTALIASKSYFSQSVHILHTVIVANQTQTSMACTRRRQGTVEQANDTPTPQRRRLIARVTGARVCGHTAID